MAGLGAAHWRPTALPACLCKPSSRRLLTPPRPALLFPRSNFKAAGVVDNKEVTLLATYLVELSLVDYASLRFPYSMIAAAATYVAQLTAGVADPFSHALSRHSSYTLPAIQECAQHLANLMRKAPVSGWRGGLLGVAGGQAKATPPAHVPTPRLPRPPLPPLQNSSLVAVYKKYSSEKLQRVATTYEAPAALLQAQ